MPTMNHYATPNSARVLLGPSDVLTSDDGAWTAYIAAGKGLAIKKNGGAQRIVRPFARRRCFRCYGLLQLKSNRKQLELVQARGQRRIAANAFDAWKSPYVDDPCPGTVTSSVSCTGCPSGNICIGPTGYAEYLRLEALSGGACLVLTDCTGKPYQAIGTVSGCTKITSLGGPGACGSQSKCGTSYCTNNHQTSFTMASALEMSDSELNADTTDAGLVYGLAISGGLIVALLMFLIGCLIYRRRKGKVEQVFMDPVEDEAAADDDVEQNMVDTEVAVGDGAREQMTAF